MNRICDVNENELIRRLKERDQAAEDELVRRYGDDIDFQIREILRNTRLSDVEPEDLFQITFMKAIQHMDTFRGPGLKTWLGRMAAHEAFQVFRHLSVRAKVEVEDNRDLTWMVTRFESPSRRVEKREAAEIVGRVFKKHDYTEARQYLVRERIKKMLGRSSRTYREIETIAREELGERLVMKEVWTVFLAHCNSEGLNLGLSL